MLTQKMQKILPGLEKLELINHIEEFLHSKDFDAKTAEIYENIWLHMFSNIP